MRTHRLSLFIAVLLLIAVGSASAQTNVSAPRRPDGGGRFGQGGDAPVLAALTEDQRASFRQALDGQRKQLRDLENNLTQARKELMGASATAPYNEALVRSKAASVAAAETEMAVIRARALSQVKPPITSDQVEKMRTLAGGNNDLSARPKAAASANGDSSTRPKGRVVQRDENDLPAVGK